MQMIGQVFTGGTGRSGTTILGAMLGNHPDVWSTLPREIRFLTDNGGLLDLTVGQRWMSLGVLKTLKTRKFSERMLGEWWERVGPDGSARGFHRGMERAEVESAVARFNESWRKDLRSASQALVRDVMEPPTRRQGASMWVDTTPANAMNAHRLLTLLPSAQVIHMVRDGRDASASVLTKKWGPKTPEAALRWWRRRMVASISGMSRAPQSQVMTLTLEDLLYHRREATYQSLLDFLGIEDNEAMSTFFETKMSAESGHIGRWKSDIPATELAEFADRYETIWHELHELGAVLPPL
jgi:hypothetical protein